MELFILGEMLLLGLNGLCIKAENLGLSAITSLLGFYEGSPVAWKKIDIVREAKTIAVSYFYLFLVLLQQTST